MTDAVASPQHDCFRNSQRIWRRRRSMSATTTMDAAAQAGAAAKPLMKRLVQPVTDVFGGVWGVGRWIWHFDLGAAVLVGEQTARFVKAAVERGIEVEPSLIKPFRKAGDSVNEALGEVGTRLKGIAKTASTAAHSGATTAHKARARATRPAPGKSALTHRVALSSPLVTHGVIVGSDVKAVAGLARRPRPASWPTGPIGFSGLLWNCAMPRAPAGVSGTSRRRVRRGGQWRRQQSFSKIVRPP